MSKIRVKNFGPIKSGYVGEGLNGWMDIKKVTVFIGNQGSGKSTIAKLISTITWMEKAINRGDIDIEKIRQIDFIEMLKYQRIHNYLNNETEIEYIGDKIRLRFDIREEFYPQIFMFNDIDYSVPKIMYVPAERNFLSVVENAFEIKTLPDTLFTFAEELRKGQLALKNTLLNLPISNNLQYRYSAKEDASFIVGKDFEVNLLESSSGFQSFVPLYLVTKFLTDELQKGESVLRDQLSVTQSIRRNKEVADVMFNKAINDTIKADKVKAIEAKYLNVSFINIVEEPEQNLYPLSQRHILNSLLHFNNLNNANKLIVTTHSPYLINYLTLSVKAKDILETKLLLDGDKKDPLIEKLYNIVPFNSMVLANDIIIYQLNEKDGTISLLQHQDNLPSDENLLNEMLGESNELFAQLLEIEQAL